MRAVDPRLLRHARAARGYLVVAVMLGLAVTGLILAQAALLAHALRAAAAVKSQLRRKLIGHSLRLGPGWLGGQQPGQITALATRGLDGLDPWFARCCTPPKAAPSCSSPTN